MADIKTAGVEKLGMVTLPGDEKEAGAETGSEAK
jgi:hypothetical protein